MSQTYRNQIRVSMDDKISRNQRFKPLSKSDNHLEFKFREPDQNTFEEGIWKLSQRQES